MEPWQFALTLLAALVAGPGFLLLGAWLLRRSGVPIGAPNVSAPHPLPVAPQGPTVDELIELRGELAAVRAEWKAHQKQLDAYLDAFEDLEESTERRRRRAAASRSKAEQAQQVTEEYAPNDREAARQRARARGFRV